MAHEVLHDPAAGLSALERLPPELLTTIFDQIGFTERDYRALQLLFPTILPYVRPHLYRTIYFTSFRVDRYHAPPALLDFWTATEGNPTLAGLVECVHIEDCRAVLLQKEMDAVSRFLKSATALKSLYIDDFPTSFLSPELASTCYRRLETLSFNCTPQGDELRNISLLPNLTLLCLAVDGNVDADESQEQLDEERLASPPLEQGAFFVVVRKLELIDLDFAGSPAQIPLKHLYMEVRQATLSTSFTNLYRKCGSLSSLELQSDVDITADILETLVSSIDPVKLRELSIRSDSAWPETANSIHESLSRFTSLTSHQPHPPHHLYQSRSRPVNSHAPPAIDHRNRRIGVKR